MTERFLNNIARHVTLTGDEIDLLGSFWIEKELNRGEYLLRNGEVCRYDNYVVSGTLKTFCINPGTGNEEILNFAIDDWWATDMESFTNQTPSEYNIQALQKTTLLQIHFQSFEKMLDAIPKLERYFRLILQNYVAAIQRRITYHSLYDAEQRYIDFITRYPDLVNRIPQYLIASYLSISPEFLSRIRAKR